jgi:hypothetical protein
MGSVAARRRCAQYAQRQQAKLGLLAAPRGSPKTSGPLPCPPWAACTWKPARNCGPRPKEGHIGPFWSFLYGLKVFGIAQGIPDWLDLREQYRAFRDEGEDGLVPFLQREGDADRLCFDRAGRIVMWHHDDPTGNRVVEQTFPEVLLHEIGGLEERLQRKQASRRQA